MSNPIDEAIREAMRKGEFDALPGAGKPLKLDDDSNVPAELRLAHRILKQNDFMPEWIALGKEIETLHTGALNALHEELRAYHGRLGDAERSEMPQVLVAEAEALWRRAQVVFREAIADLNKKLLTYNLKLPPGVARRALLNAERELERVRA
ncbi:MAG: DnaJ family domain-containing protein [Chloroflexota bacterium]|nr:DnaJ family domain-containing protein [Chloroflexota bacterium]